MLRFKSFYGGYLTEASGKKTADVGMSHEVLATHAFNRLLRTSTSPSSLRSSISKSLYGDDKSKGATGRLRVSQISDTNPIKPVLEKHPEPEARELYRDSAHTAAALAHYTSHFHGHPQSVKHVGALTAGTHNLTDEEGKKIDTNADIVIGVQPGEKQIKLLGNGLKYSTSDSGAGSTKIFSPTHNTIAKMVDSAHVEANIPHYRGIVGNTVHEGLHATLSALTQNHSETTERAVYRNHHEFLKSTFGDVSDENSPPVFKRGSSDKKRKGKKSSAAPSYDSSKEIRPINDSGMSHIRSLIDGRIPRVSKQKRAAAKAFYDELQDSNRQLQSRIADHTHKAITGVMTNIGANSRKRQAAGNLYRKLNNANSSISTIVCSTVKKPGMKKPDVHIYNHNASVEDYVKQTNAASGDYSVSKEPGTGSFKVGKINFGVDSRPGSSSIMLNGKIQNTEFKHEASYTSDPQSISNKKGKDGRVFGWDSLR
jgi:hypothetical protein